jgi:hypothetical protein
MQFNCVPKSEEFQIKILQVSKPSKKIWKKIKSKKHLKGRESFYGETYGTWKIISKFKEPETYAEANQFHTYKSRYSSRSPNMWEMDFH